MGASSAPQGPRGAGRGRVKYAGAPHRWCCQADQTDKYEGVMSKGMDQKKNTKKEPTKTLKEKRAAKAEKKNK
ncbi:hypothetical protein [Pseudoxanthomonas sp.]|uniref:hypothetical protein n=1 Tax=Pseudoxanthomonas sp. TaxID=1871049 RepID=UPI00260E602B|nr:hypothetical protein [Pseudoxanthomonas sp.]WDS37456.1 MAG: hypothetical protein O8I58_06160 [Pseudoxanthomonas sp.]